MGLPQIAGVIASHPKAVMKICKPCKLILLAMLIAILTNAPRAIADDIDPDADIPDISTMTDTTPVNPVLEIPQQCDQDSVAVLCDRSADDSSSSADADAAAPNPDAEDSGDVASNPPDVGSVYDYANQNITNEASAMGTTSVPLGVAVPAYPVLSPGPVVVSSAPVMGPGSYPQWTAGPGAYQQWVRGPGTYRSFVPGPGSPMAFGYHPFGAGVGFGGRSFGGFAGGHFGRR
jgi:hypothetical protein